MLFLDAIFTGIEVDVEQGQIENAQRQSQGFRALFPARKETGMNCRHTERLYYIDQSVKAMIKKLGKALNAFPVDPKQLGTLHRGIGKEIYFEYHLVHVAAAMARMKMAR